MNKVHRSAVVLIPPENIWAPIQALRSKHDKAYQRWMPHINLLYPFYEDTEFDNLESQVAAAVQHIRPFTVHFKKLSLGHFAHGKNSTFWLKPLDATLEADAASNDAPFHPEVIRLQSSLESAFPLCNDLSRRSDEGFKPHLTLGQCKTSQVEKMENNIKETWNEVEFLVDKLHLISRQGQDDPFVIKNTISLT